MNPGPRLGPYEITGALGAGGMGEVFRARDTKLNRDVAIKVLPAAFADDPERLARQIAEALEAAHEQGIVYRDLKPANIKVRADGTVKVLDFGLAKAMDPAGASSSNPNLSHSPTLTHQGTSAGMIIGTAAYMSPEQARGKSVDKRAVLVDRVGGGVRAGEVTLLTDSPVDQFAFSWHPGDKFPHWSATSHELLFWNQGKVMFASYSVVGDSFRAERPQVGSPVGLRAFATGYPYDLHPDGKRRAAPPPLNATVGRPTRRETSRQTRQPPPRSG